MQRQMSRLQRVTFLTLGLVIGVCWWSILFGEIPIQAAENSVEQDNGQSTTLDNHAATALEARVRAKLLHETIHGALQVMHRDFFDAEESLSIPSHSLEDVFEEVADSFGVQIRWLAVNAKAMNVDNKPGNEFEHNAVKALSDGKDHYETVSGEAYQYVGTVKLSSQCLKCHLPARSSNDSKVAGLVITMPLKKPSK